MATASTAEAEDENESLPTPADFFYEWVSAIRSTYEQSDAALKASNELDASIAKVRQRIEGASRELNQLGVDVPRGDPHDKPEFGLGTKAVAAVSVQVERLVAYVDELKTAVTLADQLGKLERVTWYRPMANWYDRAVRASEALNTALTTRTGKPAERIADLRKIIAEHPTLLNELNTRRKRDDEVAELRRQLRGHAVPHSDYRALARWQQRAEDLARESEAVARHEAEPEPYRTEMQKHLSEQGALAKSAASFLSLVKDAEDALSELSDLLADRQLSDKRYRDWMMEANQAHQQLAEKLEEQTATAALIANVRSVGMRRAEIIAKVRKEEADREASELAAQRAADIARRNAIGGGFKGFFVGGFYGFLLGVPVNCFACLGNNGRSDGGAFWVCVVLGAAIGVVVGASSANSTRSYSSSSY